jgi:hypothetical protein
MSNQTSQNIILQEALEMAQNCTLADISVTQNVGQDTLTVQCNETSLGNTTSTINTNICNNNNVCSLSETGSLNSCQLNPVKQNVQDEDTISTTWKTVSCCDNTNANNVYCVVSDNIQSQST